MKAHNDMKNKVIKNYIKELKKNNCKIINLKLDPKYSNDINPACFLEFIKDGFKYLTLLEIDYIGLMDNMKINKLYENFYKEKEKYNEFQGTFPILIIVTKRKGIRYNSKNFEVVYTEPGCKNLEKFLF